MGDASLFLRKFLRHGIAIASVAPSSRWLSRATVRPINWELSRVVVELGAGTGPITRVIAENAPESCRVVVLERDADFFRILKARYAHLPNFDVVHGDVRHLRSVLANLGIDQVDHVVSGLPTPSLPGETRLLLFDALQSVLGPEGGFHQITEIPWIYLPFYRKHFEHVRFVLEPRNIPPAGVYHCRVVKPLAGSAIAPTAAAPERSALFTRGIEP